MHNDHHLVNLAIGHILRMGSRATKPGDAQAYERCRAIITRDTPPQQSDYQPAWERDRLKGAQGD